MTKDRSTRRTFVRACGLGLVPFLAGCGGGSSSLPEPPGGVEIPADPNDLPIMKDAAKGKAKGKGK